jgi:hypothetical protein
MADEKRVARTAGESGTFHVGDLTITPEGTELTRDEWMTVADAAVVSHVIVRLDEEFPPQAEPKAAEETDAGAAGENKEQTQDTGTAVDGAPAPASSSTGTTRKGR